MVMFGASGMAPISAQPSQPRDSIGGGSLHNMPLSSNFRASTRSRPESETIEALVASSESDHDPRHTPWGGISSQRFSYPRSSGVSPARRPSGSQTNGTFPTSYPSFAVGQGPTARQSSLSPHEELLEGLASYTFNPESTRSRPDASAGPWADNVSVRSPNDDRNSVAPSEYYGPSSGASSRNGSLPPSRQGAESVQSGFADLYSQFELGGRQYAPFSRATGRMSQERSGSIQSDSFHRMRLEQDSDTSMMSHRPSMSTNANAFSSTLASAMQASGSPPARIADMQDLRANGSSYGNPGSFTPNSYNTNGSIANQNGSLRHTRFDSRGTQNPTAADRSPANWQSQSQPFDYLYPSRSNPNLLRANSTAHTQNGNPLLQQNALQMQQLQFQSEQRTAFHSLQLAQAQALNPYMSADQLQQQLLLPPGFPNSVPFPTNENQQVPPRHSIPPGPGSRNHGTSVTQSDTGHRSRQLAILKDGLQNNQKFELEFAFDHIVEFCGDQNGSRFIQQKLEQATSDQKEQIFREVIPDALQLMLDCFGNYVMQKLFEHGDQAQKKVLASKMIGHVPNLSTNIYGCRVVQKALDHVLTEQQALLVAELAPDVLKFVRDQHGNHCIQKAISRVPIEHIGFILDAFRGQVCNMSLDKYGCRVVQRLLEKVPEPNRRFILEELLDQAPKLIPNDFGNYVTQHVVEHGLPHDRAKMIGMVEAQLLHFSTHKFASNVVERCLVHGTSEQRRSIMLKIIANDVRGENCYKLLRDDYGNYVIQKIMDTLAPQDWYEFVDVLLPEHEKAKKVSPAKQINQIEKKLARFPRVETRATSTPQRSSLSSEADNPFTPPQNSTAQSPQSSSLPSANASTVDGPIKTHTDPSSSKHSTTVTMVPSRTD